MQPSITGRVVKLDFNNIMLPDSTSSEPQSHGWVKYRVKMNNNLQPGTQIKNTAYIYFDFNPAIVTNTTLNTLDSSSVGNKNIANKENLSIYPNPASTFFTVEFSTSKNEELLVEIVDALGNIVLTKQINQNNKQISTESIAEGIYIVKVYTENTVSTSRLIINK